jgi:hypothetical protein
VSEPSPFGNLTPADMSHAMLVAILMHNGGGYTLPMDALEVDALGRPDGSHHAVQMVPLADGSGVRLMVIARPEGPDAVLRVQPYEPPPQE